MVSVEDQINDLLEEWDPLGVHMYYKNGPTNEYINYIPQIITAHKENNSILEYLISLHTALINYPNEESMELTKHISEKMYSLLSENKS